MGEIINFSRPSQPVVTDQPQGFGFGGEIQPNTVTRIYCGRNIPSHAAHDGRNQEVRDGSVQKFIDTVLSRYFPYGFTVYDAKGGWQDQTSGETIEERSIIIELVHAPFEQNSVDVVAQEWKRWFSQDSVMMTQTPARVSFV